MAPYLNPSQLAKVFVSAQKIETTQYRVWTLGVLAPYLSDSLLAEALAETRSNHYDPQERARLLTKFVPHLPPDRRTEIIFEIRDIDPAWYQVQALEGLTPYLPTELLTEALNFARAIEDVDVRVEMLVHLAINLPTTQQSVIWNEALVSIHTRARSRWDSLEEEKSAQTLAHIIPFLPADYLPFNLLAHDIGACGSVDAECHLAGMLTIFSSHMAPDLVPYALTAARAIEDTYARAKALTALAPRLPLTQQWVVWAEVLASIRFMHATHRHEQYNWPQLLACIAQHLPPFLFPEVVNIIRAIDKTGIRLKILIAIAPYLTSD